MKRMAWKTIMMSLLALFSFTLTFNPISCFSFSLFGKKKREVKPSREDLKRLDEFKQHLEKLHQVIMNGFHQDMRKAYENETVALTKYLSFENVKRHLYLLKESRKIMFNEINKKIGNPKRRILAVKKGFLGGVKDFTKGLKFTREKPGFVYIRPYQKLLPYMHITLYSFVYGLNTNNLYVLSSFNPKISKAEYYHAIQKAMEKSDKEKRNICFIMENPEGQTACKIVCSADINMFNNFPGKPCYDYDVMKYIQDEVLKRMNNFSSR